MKKSGDHQKKIEWKSILFNLFISFSFLLLGHMWTNDIKTKGYYKDTKHQVEIYGNAGLVTTYMLIIVGYLLLAYTIYLILIKIKK